MNNKNLFRRKDISMRNVQLTEVDIVIIENLVKKELKEREKSNATGKYNWDTDSFYNLLQKVQGKVQW